LEDRVMKKQIITISREFGSGGHLVGKVLAEKMDVPYYDKSILDRIAEEKGYSVEMMEEDEKRAKNSFLYSLTTAFGSAGTGPDYISINEKFFLAQFDYIRRIAKEGSCVIVGRCADYVLRDMPFVTNVFIYADKQQKFKRIVNEYGLSREDAEKGLRDVDKARANYYKYHTGQEWGRPENYHLCINSSNISLGGCTDIIMKYQEIKTK